MGALRSGSVVLLAVLGAVCLGASGPAQQPAQQPGSGRETESLDLALGLIQRGLWEDAAKHLQRFLKEQPEHDRAAEAHYRLGTSYLELGNDGRAIGSLERALRQRKFALRAECRYRLGHTLKKDGKHRDLERAAGQFARLVREEGKDHYLAAAALYAEGECLRDLGRSQEALKRFQSAAAATKSDEFGLPARYQAGFLLLKGKQYQEASETFLLAAQRHPRHKARGECLYLAGEAALRGGDTRAASEAFRQAVAAGGDHVRKAMLGLARCSRQGGDRQAAIRQLQEVRERFPKDPVGHEARVEAARLLFEEKRFAEAMAELQPVLGESGAGSNLRRNAHEVSGLACLELGQPKPASQHLTQALALTTATDKQDRARLAYHLGEAHADLQDWKAAVTWYGRAADEAPPDKSLLGDALYGQCLALHRLERFQDANKAIARFLEVCPRHRLAIAAGFAWAENHFAQKDYETARDAYLALPKDHELWRKARFKAAWCSYLMKEHAAAAKDFRGLADEDREDPLCEEALSMVALAAFQVEDFEAALAAADRYRARYSRGKHLARSERVAARVLKRQGKLTAAAERLAAAAAAGGSGARSGQDLLEYADVLYQRGDYEGAGNAYRKLVTRKDATGARAHEGLAWCAFELGEDKACGEWIDRGLEHPEGKASRANLLELRSSLHHRNQEWEAAERVAEQFLKEHRQHPRALHVEYSLGVAQSRNKKLPQAQRTLERVRGREGFDRFEHADRVCYELAWVYRNLGQEDLALESFREVARRSQDVDLRGEAWLHLGEALLKQGEGNHDEALACLAKVEGKYKGRARYRIGFHWFEKGQPEKALPAFRAILEVGPGAGLYLDALFLAGECHYRLGEHEDAARRFEQLLEKAPEHERAQLARLHLGNSQLQGKQPQAAAAVAALEEYLRRAGDKEGDKTERARAQLWLGQARQARHDWAGAEAAFLATTRLTDTELAAEAQYRIGECRRARGDVEGAADAFVKLPILYGHDTWVQRGLFAAGDCYLQLQQPKKAKRFYQELVTRYPRSDLARDARKKLEDIQRRL